MGLLAVDDNKAFVEQMNSEAWFGWVAEEQRCSAEALKVYAAVDFGREKMTEPQFDASVHGSNARYQGYCELKLVYDKLCDVWDEGKILEK